MIYAFRKYSTGYKIWPDQLIYPTPIMQLSFVIAQSFSSTAISYGEKIRKDLTNSWPFPIGVLKFYDLVTMV